jgi:nicotinate-nucleotide adenylyltransferase
MSDLQKLQEIADCFEFMPDSSGRHFQNELPPLFLKHKIENAVTFFGGSFNPFHEGHRACLDLCPEKNILIVPDRNPFKDVRSSKFAYEEFMQLARGLEATRYSLYPGFLIKAEKNPTSSWLPRVRIAEKNLLMGDDSYMSFLKWNNPEAIVTSLSKLYVVPRKFTKTDYMAIEPQLLSWNPDLLVHYLADHPYKNISSTDIRETRLDKAEK